MSLSGERRAAIRGRELRNCFAYSATPLALNDIFEIAIISLDPHLSGTVSVGLSLDPPNSTCHITGSYQSLQLVLHPKIVFFLGNEFLVNNKVVQHFTPHLRWLRIGDRVSLQRDQEGVVRATINSEVLPLHFPSFTEDVYVVVELKGNCSAVAVTSRSTPPSPLTSVRLQDSLELVLEPQSNSKIEVEIPM